MIIAGLKLAVPVIGHTVAVIRTISLSLFLQQNAETVVFGLPGFLLSGSLPFTLRFWHSDYHLNRIHFEIALHSVCCDNPSLDKYFNSVPCVCIYYIGILYGKDK